MITSLKTDTRISSKLREYESAFMECCDKNKMNFAEYNVANIFTFPFPFIQD